MKDAFRNSNSRAAAVAAIALLGSVANAEYADARIACAKGFQNVSGSWLATPYCQDAYLAEVAAQYGMRAPASQIRENPNYKREVCRLVGPDIRIKETCGEANAYGRRF